MQSPLKLVSSLKHGDPQAVAFTAVAVFLLSVFWFSWTFLSPQTQVTLPLGNGRPRAGNPPETTSLQNVLAEQRGYVTPEDIPNPFYREPPPGREPRKSTRNKGNAKPEKDNENPSTANKKPEAKPQTRTLTIIYKGLLTRPDQQTVALLSVAETDTQYFLKNGDKLETFTLNKISPEGVELQQDKEPVIFLSRGTGKELEVPL